MPLSKARMRERKRLDRLNVKPKLEDVKPNEGSVRSKLPWYAGAESHFGEVKSQYYAKQFFASLT